MSAAGDGIGPKGTNQIASAALFRPAPPSRITVLRQRGTGRVVELPSLPSFTLGREATAAEPVEALADLRLVSPRKGMSVRHAMFEWRVDRLWCRDARSTNGTLANGEPMHDWFPVSSGMMLDFGDVHVVALDWRLVELCASLAWCLGLDAAAEVDRALQLVQKDGAMLLVGARGCDQEWLARQIHETSGRRERPFLALTEELPRAAERELTPASWGTVFVDLASVGKVSKAFATALFTQEAEIPRFRPIIAATSLAHFGRVFDGMAPPPLLQLPSLGSRRTEVARLLDQLMEQSGSPHRVRELGEDRLARLAAHDWSRNLHELREAERRIRALLEGGNVTQAARLVGSSRQALDKFLRRLFDE